MSFYDKDEYAPFQQQKKSTNQNNHQQTVIDVSDTVTFGAKACRACMRGAGRPCAGCEGRARDPAKALKRTYGMAFRDTVDRSDRGLNDMLSFATSKQF
jgi:hypothetical protein